MRRSLLAFVLAVTAVVSPAGAGPASACSYDVNQLADIAGHPRIHTYAVQSPALGCGARRNFRVLVPTGYVAGQRKPVVFLLHGAGGDYTDWLKNTDLEAFTATTDAVFVMPDGGGHDGLDSGWYSDWVNGPHWESHHFAEVLRFVDTSFTAVTPNGRPLRAIAGLSMGGFGAMSYAARHPDHFIAAGSFSGAVDNADLGLPQAEAYKELHAAYGTPDERVWGDYTDSEITWRDHNPADLQMNLATVGSTDADTRYLSTGDGVPGTKAAAAPVPIDSPTGSPTEAGVYLQNTVLRAVLLADGVPFTFNDRGPGTHAWPYWQDDLHAWLPKAMAAFAAAGALPRRPATFNYRSAETSFSVWGWRFQVARPAKEFLDVTNAGPNGFTLKGSGLVYVTPPASVPVPSFTYSWTTLTGGGYGDSGAPIFNPDGTRTIKVDLTAGQKPAHAADEFTPMGRVNEAVAGPDYWTTTAVRIG